MTIGQLHFPYHFHAAIAQGPQHRILPRNARTNYGQIRQLRGQQHPEGYSQPLRAQRCRPLVQGWPIAGIINPNLPTPLVQQPCRRHAGNPQSQNRRSWHLDRVPFLP